MPADAKTSAKTQLGSSEVSVEGGEVERDMPQVIEETLHVKAKYKASLRRFTCRFTFENISKLGPILCIYICVLFDIYIYIYIYTERERERERERSYIGFLNLNQQVVHVQFHIHV